MNFDFDLIVIGAGSGGTRAARLAAQAGAKVAIIEESHFGGTCVNLGCIPKKLLAMGAHFKDDFDDAHGYGWNVSRPKFDWPTLRDNTQKEITRLTQIYKHVLTTHHVTIYEGSAVVVGEHGVEINGDVITGKIILIATGSLPHIPTYPGYQLAVTSNEMFSLETLPKTLLIQGGGYIALEFASIFSSLGVKVTLVHRGPQILRGFDDEIRAFLLERLIARQIDIRLNTTILSLRENGKKRIATLNTQETITADVVLNATGRVPHTAGLDLAKHGVMLSGKGAVIVSDYHQSSVPSIYAIGDVLNTFPLTPVAIRQAHAFVQTVFYDNPTILDYATITTAVFSNPNVGYVGLTEAQARKIYGEIGIYSSIFRSLKHSISGRDEKTFVKIIVEKKTDIVVGIHMVGADAGEIIQGFAFAVTIGATKAQLDKTFAIHPTVAEELVTLTK